jgi:hypothetical protein
LFVTLNSCDTIDTDNWQKQITSGDDSFIPDSIKSLMKEDAAHLVLRDIYSDPFNKENLVYLLDDLVELYYRGFVHIYNAKSLSARNQVIENYKIHTLCNLEMHYLAVSVDSSTAWVYAWRNGNRLTGNEQVDLLMETYNLELYRVYQWDYISASLYSDSAVNVYAISKKFEPIEGVIYAEPDGCLGDGNDITGSIKSDYIEYNFSHGWGDCPAGCISRHYWLFRVQFDGTVIFIKSYGDPL